MASDDPYGLGVAGIGYGGYSDGFSVNGVDLTLGARGHLTAAHRGGGGGDAGQSTIASLAVNPAQRKKLVSDMVELLEKHRALHSFDAFTALSTVDLRLPSHAKLLDDLKRNTKIAIDEQQQTITYKVSSNTPPPPPHPQLSSTRGMAELTPSCRFPV